MHPAASLPTAPSLQYDNQKGGGRHCRRKARDVSRSERDGRAAWRMKPPFRILEHTADVGFEAFGSTRQEAHENAARALFGLMIDPGEVAPAEKVSIEVTGSDPLNLLVNWLSELLYLHDAEQWLFRDFELTHLDDHAASGAAWGEKFNRARHRTNLQIKAITYHQLSLEQCGAGWRAQVYVDI